ncbi:MAG: hypothetical protein AAF789_14365, partial [Bacteroidota bacterium]
LATSEGLDRAFEYFPNADMRAKCSIGQSGLILLKILYLIGGGAADSILSTTGRIGDDGTETRGASGVVLRFFA